MGAEGSLGCGQVGGKGVESGITDPFLSWASGVMGVHAGRVYGVTFYLGMNFYDLGCLIEKWRSDFTDGIEQVGWFLVQGWAFWGGWLGVCGAEKN